MVYIATRNSIHLYIGESSNYVVIPTINFLQYMMVTDSNINRYITKNWFNKSWTVGEIIQDLESIGVALLPQLINMTAALVEIDNDLFDQLVVDVNLVDVVGIPKHLIEEALIEQYSDSLTKIINELKVTE